MSKTRILLQLWLEENAFLLLFPLILISFSPHSLLNISVSLSLSWRSTKQSIVWGSIWETDSTVS